MRHVGPQARVVAQGADSSGRRAGRAGGTARAAVPVLSMPRYRATACRASAAVTPSAWSSNANLSPTSVPAQALTRRRGPLEGGGRRCAGDGLGRAGREPERRSPGMDRRDQPRQLGLRDLADMRGDHGLHLVLRPGGDPRPERDRPRKHAVADACIQARAAVAAAFGDRRRAGARPQRCASWPRAGCRRYEPFCSFVELYTGVGGLYA